jgi:hypothetical protein
MGAIQLLDMKKRVAEQWTIDGDRVGCPNRMQTQEAPGGSVERKRTTFLGTIVIFALAA